MSPLSLDVFNLIVEVGIFQGIIMAVVLFFLPVKHSGKVLFSLILLILALLSFKILLHTLDLWNLPMFHFFPLAIDTTLPPLLYLYIRAITNSEPSGRKSILYFIPTIVFMAYAVLVYIWALPLQDNLLKDELAGKLLFNKVKDAEDFVAVISAVIYWIAGFKRIVNYREWLFSSQSDNRFQEFTWLKNLLVISGILVLAIMVVVTLEDILSVGQHHFIHLQVFYIYIAFITYYLSIKGFALYNTPGRFIRLGEKPLLKDGIDVPKLPEDDLHAIKSLIIHSLETNRIYLNPELSIKEMAQNIGYPVASVSMAVNKCFGMNFRNLINKYRVEEVKRLLKDPPSHLSMLGIALECGFNSEASFYRIFRQETGLSPSDYMKSNK